MFYRQDKKQINTLNRRTVFLGLVKLSIFSVIGWRLFDIQIVNSKKYKTLSKNNQINLEILYPVRGEIKDRNGKLLASNKLVYDLYIIPEQAKNLEETLNNLNHFIFLDFKKKRQVIELSKKVKKFESIKILENLDWKKLEMIELNKNHLSGLKLRENFQRTYPYKDYFSHLIGYISQPTQTDLNLPYISKMPKLNIGRTGIEKYSNERLIGIAGQKEIEVNSNGRVIREISRTPSKKGESINLSIDQRVQKFTYNLMKEHKAGSVVVIKIATGEIISMVSVPSFDPNLIITKPNIEYWDSLLNNPLSPLTNRSIQGLYAPGSTFKMLVALAALKYNVIDSKTTEFCEGKIEFGDRFYHCWKTRGHGSVNVEKAIKESCDTFFYKTALKIGIEKIAEIAEDFGMGEVYGVGLGNEKKGIIPSKKWKLENKKENWYAGETLLAGIGQGYGLSNPLQLAVMIARISSNGLRVEPTLYKKNNKLKFKKVSYDSSENFNIIKNAMFKVVNESQGTAYGSKSSEYSFSGKTGTSQVKKITLEERESDEFRKKEIEWKNKDHALFVGYMPSKKPKYAISVVIEHGGSGASSAAPIAKKTFDYIYKLKI